MRARWGGRVALLVATLVLALAGVVVAQRRPFFYGWDETVKNAPYDGRFTFARVRYRPAPGGNWAGGRPSWVHGYPLAERNLMQIMKEVSLLDANVDNANVVTLDDPATRPRAGHAPWVDAQLRRDPAGPWADDDPADGLGDRCRLLGRGCPWLTRRCP